jgi:hypothetical protein
MPKAIVLAAIVLAAPMSAAAQQVTIDDLSAPTTPAFVLLDVAPTAIDRPDTPRSFVLNALNRLSSADGGFPKDYALQVAPYWMASHPNLSFAQYQNPSRGQSLLQSFSVSIATSPIPGATKSAAPLGTHLAVGFSTRFWNGRPNPILNEAVGDLEAINVRILDRLRADPNADISALRTEASAKALEIQGLDAQRIGFFLTLSGGQAWDFTGDDVRTVDQGRGGIWLTPAWRVRTCADTDACESTFDFVAVLRMLDEPEEDATVDYGGRLIWRPTRQFNISVETLRRNAPSVAAGTSSSRDSNRTAGLLEYRIREDLIFYGSFGQDFRKVTGVKPLISQMGLNLGFGPKPKVNAGK